MARILWKRLNPTDFNAMTGSAAISSSGGGARHIVLGTSKEGNRIETFLPPLQNHQVTIDTQAGPRWPKASLTFTSNPERRKGEWLISDQKSNRHPAWTTAAGFPPALDLADPPVIFVLKVDDEYYVDWRPQQSLASIAPLIAAADRGVADAPPELLSELLLQPLLSPVDAQVTGEQLQYADDSRAEVGSSEAIVEAVRETHLTTAARLAAYLAGSNVGPAFGARFEAVHDLLRNTLSSERGLQLAIHVRGLEGMMDAIAERLDEVTVADIAVFTADLIDLLNQLPAYRRFVVEARAVEPTTEAVGAGASVVSAFDELPDVLVEPRLKQVLGVIRTLAQERVDGLTQLALVRSVGNVLRRVGRYLNERLSRFGQGATKAFDENAGPDFGKAMSRLLKLAYVAAAVKILQAAFPGEFAFVGQLLRAVQTLFP